VGVERAVTRWYALRQTILREVDALQVQLERLQAQDQPDWECAEVRQQLALAQARLFAIGPCPKPMMG